MIWAKKVRDLGQKRNNLGHRFGPKNTKFRAKNVYLPELYFLLLTEAWPPVSA